MTVTKVDVNRLLKRTNFDAFGERLDAVFRQIEAEQALVEVDF